MTVSYVTPRDVYDLGLSAQAFVVRPRALSSRAGDTFEPSTGTFSLIGHGLASDDLVRLVLIASGGSLPGGASASTVYSPLTLDFWRFRLALSEGGPAVTFTTAGSSVADGSTSWGIQVDPERRLMRIALSCSADLDQDLTAHATPIEVDPTTGKYPEKLVGICARMAARRALTGQQFENPAFKVAAERVFAEEKRDDEQRAAWRLGQPLYPTPRDQTDGQADNGGQGLNRFSGSGRCVRPAPWVTGRL